MSIALIASGCYYDVEEELYPANSCSTSSVGYTATVLPLLQTQCYSCHSDATKSVGGGISIEGHSNLLVYVNNGKLLGSLNHQQGYSAMPSNGSKLSDCKIAQIQKWVDNGAKND
ncbi:MAG: hypothetical protein IPH16_06050 [Haliscomenobacter sp.]|nr:hypothetical protein [Haliscomenobacter sp.]